MLYTILFLGDVTMMLSHICAPAVIVVFDAALDDVFAPVLKNYLVWGIHMILLAHPCPVKESSKQELPPTSLLVIGI